MSNLWYWLINTPQNHPAFYGLFLFVLSCLVSIYSAEIKRFVREWPQHKYRTAARKNLTERLIILKFLHDNAYNLTLYSFGQIASAVVQGFFLSLGVMLITLLSKHKFPSLFEIWSTFGGVMIGRAFYLEKLYLQLVAYIKTVAELETELRAYADLDTEKADGVSA